MPRKTRKQKLKSDLRRKVDPIFSFSYEYKAQNSKSAIKPALVTNDDTLIKKDILKTLVIGLTIIGVEFFLYLKTH